MLWFFLALAALLGLFACNTCLNALRSLSRPQVEQLGRRGRGFWFHTWLRTLHPSADLEGLTFIVLATGLLLKVCYIVASALLLVELELAPYPLARLSWSAVTLTESVLLVFLLLGLYLSVGDFLPRYLAHSRPEHALRRAGTVASLFLLLFWPFTGPALLLTRVILGPQRVRLLFEARHHSPERLLESMESQDSVLEIQERKLITSVMTFRSKVAREVMVPRVRTFALEASLTVAEAAAACQDEGYSRVPVYRDSLDHVVGTLLVKDLLGVLLQVHGGGSPSLLQQPISSLVKPIIFIPENQRISVILQEFRARQLHLAVVVDEYGGTEGMVTIEDILEEIVGEIGDEYDVDECALYVAQAGGAWVVEAQMGILDLEDKLGIRLPTSPEYDTVGGFVFHVSGTIPAAGHRIHTEAADIEVVSSNERCIERVRIHPVERLS